MSAEVFLDSNILVYAATGTGKDVVKRQRAQQLIRSQNFAISAQVLQEFYVTVVKKAALKLTAAEALEWVEELISFPCQSVDQRLVRIAIELSARWQISYWDAAIVAAARAQGCHTIFSEDFNHGQKYEGVTVLNPFQ